MFILIFAFIYGSFSSIFASMDLIPNIYINKLPNIDVHNISDIKCTLASLKNPFTKKDKLEKTKDLLTGEQFFDGCMFQACIFEEYEHGDKNTKILNYMIYKTSKYFLTLLKSILENPDLASRVLFKNSKINNILFDIQKLVKYKLFKNQIQIKEFVLHGCETLYKELQQFSKNENIHSFTPQDVFSYSFLFAFLHDIAYYVKPLNYCSLNYDFIQYMHNTSCINTFEQQKEPQAQTLVASLLDFYTEEYAGPINFVALQKWHGNHTNFIFPIINSKNGIIGLNTLNLYSAKQYCLVGFGTKKSSAHNNSLNALTDLAFHDLLHGRLPLKSIENGETPSLGRRYFFKTVTAIMPDLISQYRQAKELNNVALQQKITKYTFALFFGLHEMEPLPGSFDSIRTQHYMRKNITDAVSYFIELQNLNPTDTNKLIDPKILHDILFHALDMLILFQKAYPELSETLNQYDLKIEQDFLISTRKHSKNHIQYNQLLPVLKHLQWCMTEAWSCFFEKYSIMFNGTMPFMKEDRRKLSFFEATIDL